MSSILCCGGESDSTKLEQKTSRPLHTTTSQPPPQKQPVAASPNMRPSKGTTTTAAPKKQREEEKDLSPQLNKTDITVYEGTDSTVDTSDNLQPQDTDCTATRSLDDGESSSKQVDGSASLSGTDGDDEEDDDVMEDGDVIDDFFDLTQLQPGQSHADGCSSLLGPAPKHLQNRKCLILDLDETLVHSSFKYMRQADFVIPVDIENQLHNVYVIKRPGVDEFMKRVGELYEVVVFTASVSRYGDPLLDALDIHKSVHHRLFRDSCYNYQGNYIKNLSQIGRPLSDLIILDNSPASYIFHPQHAIPISSWFSDAHDNELLDIIPFLEDLAKENVEDIGLVLDINL